MSEVSQALQKIARGTGIVFAGTVISMFFGFLSRALIARYFSVSGYGVFNLALTVLSIVLVIATLGFPSALPREVAFYKEREPSRVRDLISTALIIVTLNSLIWTAILFLEAENISQVFNEERLVYALKVVAFALPFSALTGTIISISRGFGRIREKVYIQDIVYPIVFLVLVVAGAFLRLSFTYVFFGYVVAQALTLLALTFDVWKIKLFEFGISLNLKLGKEFIRFSIPLMLTGILGFIVNWTDTLMLGYYKSTELVGLYNAVAPLARLIIVVLNSASFIYIPIAAAFYSQQKMDKIKELYRILTKWIYLATVPISMLFILFPKLTIGIIFGDKYISAHPVLTILSIGFTFHVMSGFNGGTLIIIGKSELILISDILVSLTNFVFNTIMIPKYGIVGAAIATTISYLIGNSIILSFLYAKTKISPFTWDYIKSMLSFVLVIVLSKVLIGTPQTEFYTIIQYFLILSIYYVILYTTGAIRLSEIQAIIRGMKNIKI